MPAWLPRKWPLWPTLLVALAVITMIALGIWQIQRHGEKRQAIAVLEDNLGKPAMRFPELGPVPTENLFRRASVNCLSVDSWSREAGRAADGTSGFRLIAHCVTGAEGPGALVALGVSARPDTQIAWNGGAVSGWIVREPDHRSLIERLTGPEVVLRPMLIAEASPVGALKNPAPPSPDSIADNHMAYAVQWFLFAAAAVVIYVLALAKRQNAGSRDS